MVYLYFSGKANLWIVPKPLKWMLEQNLVQTLVQLLQKRWKHLSALCASFFYNKRIKLETWVSVYCKQLAFGLSGFFYFKRLVPFYRFYLLLHFFAFSKITLALNLPCSLKVISSDFYHAHHNYISTSPLMSCINWPP